MKLAQPFPAPELRAKHFTDTRIFLTKNLVFISPSGHLNRLNAKLSLLHPLDRYRTPIAIGSEIGRPYLSLPRIHAQVGSLNRLILNRFGSSAARLWSYSV